MTIVCICSFVVYIFLCRLECSYVYVQLCSEVCVCVCKHARAHLLTHKHSRACTHIHTHTHTHTHTHIGTTKRWWHKTSVPQMHKLTHLCMCGTNVFTNTWLAQTLKILQSDWVTIFVHTGTNPCLGLQPELWLQKVWAMLDYIMFDYA